MRPQGLEGFDRRPCHKIEVRDDKGDQGGGRSEDGKRQIAFLERYTVFNAEQINGIDAQYPTPAPIITAANPDQRDAELDALFGRVPVTLPHRHCEMAGSAA